MATRWPGPSYEVRADFRAPLDFVYRWCTDFSDKDAVYEGDTYERRILRRTSKQVVYEDLQETANGWLWARHVVTLLPPNRWHSDSVGSHRDIRLDYRLSRVGAEGTRLTLKARRRPTGVGTKNLPRSKWEKSVHETWMKFGKAMEREYRQKRARKR